MLFYEKRLKLFNYSFGIGSGLIWFGCIMRIVFVAIDASDWSTYDTLSYVLPLFSATGIMIVIFVALIKLLRVRRQYNIELNMAQVVIANLYILTYLIVIILDVLLHTIASNLNKSYGCDEAVLREDEFADKVD